MPEDVLPAVAPSDALGRVGARAGLHDLRRLLTTERSAPGSSPALEIILAVLLVPVVWAVGVAAPGIVADPLPFLGWAGALAAASLCTFTASRRKAFDVSLAGAVAILVALRFDPATAITLVFMSAFVLREIRGQAPWRLAVFNRAQSAVSAGAASAAVHALPLGAPGEGILIIVTVVGIHVMGNGVLTAVACPARGKLSFGSGLLHAFGPTWSTGTCYVAAMVLAASAFQLGVGEELGAAQMALLLLAFAVAAIGLRAATQAAVARDELREALAHSLRSARDDRAVIGRYLHDEAMQSLSAASVLLASCRRDMGDQAPPQLAEAETALRQSVTAARDLLGRVAPPRVPEGLGAAVSRELDVLEALGIRTELHDGVGRVADEDVAGVLFGAVREALRNVRKHAAANHVEVRMRSQDGGIEITVTDDGRGLDPRAVSAAGGGHGIVLLRETLRGMGGTVTLTDRRGEPGARMAIRLPKGNPHGTTA